MRFLMFCKFCFNRVKFLKKFHPAFVLIILLFLFFGKFILVASFLLALTLHELAHAFVAKKLGYKLKNLSLMPYGACLMYQDIFTNDDEFYIAIAGPFINLLVAGLTIAFWWIAPVTFFITYNFVLFNFTLAIFNLLPAFPLDGARIAMSLLQKKMPRKKAFLITVVFNYVLSVVFILCFIFSLFTKINFNFLIISIFLILGIFDSTFQAKYLKAYNFDKTKYLNKGIRGNTIVFSSNVKLNQMLKKIALNKYTVFAVVFKQGKVKFLSEDYLKSICENFSHNLTFDDIYFFFDK